MKDKERDIFDDLFRSKLQDFEADTMPGDWEAIADRLPVKKSVPFRRTLRYWGAAAVISLLVVTGGVYVFNRDREHLPVAETIQKETEAVENRLTERSESVTPAVVASKPVDRIAKRAVAQVTAVTTSRSDITVDEVVLSPENIRSVRSDSGDRDGNADRNTLFICGCSACENRRKESTGEKMEFRNGRW